MTSCALPKRCVVQPALGNHLLQILRPSPEVAFACSEFRVPPLGGPEDERYIYSLV